MKDLFKFLGFAILFSWGIWTGVTVGICYFFHTNFNEAYMIVGIAYIILLIGAAGIVAKRY